MLEDKVGKKCTACTACYNSCPYSAIKMASDEEGFMYPHIEKNQCVECGMCEKVCPIIQGDRGQYMQPEVYAGWNLDEEIRINSTSGGIFSALATEILNMEGLVVGAYYDKDFSVKHGVIEKKEDIKKLRQSKYTQSNLNEVFRIIKKKLENGKIVLFCGTPCQSSGLQHYLRKSYENLYCCDFICRGVTSQKVYKKFIDDISAMHGTRIKKIQFKNKDFGWNQFTTKLIFTNGAEYQKDRYEDYYMRGYLKHNLYLRPACHECQFKKIPRVSDISLGDFWGIGNYGNYLDDDKGTSVILVNSEKGHNLLNKTKKNLYLERRTLDEVLKGNVCLLHVAEKGKFREFFFKNMKSYRFDKLIEKIDKKNDKVPYVEKLRFIISRIKNII